MTRLINIFISIAAFLLALVIAAATGIDLVLKVVILAFTIQWVAFIPAYIFQTEKFYDLTGSLTYLSAVWILINKKLPSLVAQRVIKSTIAILAPFKLTKLFELEINEYQITDR